MSSSSEEEYQSAEDESSHGPQLASRLGELGLCGVGGEPRGSEVAATVGGTKTDGVATDGNVTSVAKKDSSVGSEGEDESSRGAWGAEAKGGTLSGEDEVEYVGNLDNRYVSEDVTVLGDKVELSEEQVKELRERANKVKKEGNDRFKSGDYKEAVVNYTEALQLYPPSSCEHEVAVCYANRAACYVKMEEHQNVIDDCTKALELEPDYLKAVMRRAQSYEALEKYEEALEDHKKVLELDPSQATSRRAVAYLPEKVKEQHEKMKAEMLGKLKELGDAVLKPFGLSTSNFQFQQDPNTGGYSVNFKR